MRRPELYVERPAYGYGDNPCQHFDLTWPISEVMLHAEMSCEQSIEDIASKYHVSVAEVLKLRESYELDFG